MRSPRFFLFRCLWLCLVLTLASGAAAVEEVTLTEDGESKSAPAPAAAPPVSDSEAGVMVRPFDGPKSKTLHDAVVEALEGAGVILIPAGFEEGAKLGDAPEPYVDVARKVGIKAFLHGKTSMSKKSWTLQLRVRNAADGTIIAEPALSAGWLPGLKKKIDAELMGVLEKHLAATSMPKTAEEVSLVADSEVSLTGIADHPGHAAGARAPTGAHSPFDASLGAGALFRKLSYNKPVGDYYEHGLQSPDLLAPTLRAGVHVYPGAWYVDGPAAHVGLAASYYRTIGGSTNVIAGGTTHSFTTTFTELNIGLRGRIPLRSKLELGLNGGWGLQTMVMEGDNEELPTEDRGDPGVVPDSSYTYFRFGPDLSFEFGVPLEVGLLYRTPTLSSEDGYFAEDRWFPNAAAIGIEVYARGTYPLTDTLGLLIGIEARYYGIDANAGSYADNTDPGGNAHPVNPTLSDNRDGLIHSVAAGANDTYLGGFLSIEYTMPGVAR